MIAPRPLTEYLPLACFKGSADTVTTQFDMHGVERIGLLKMDFLGLRTLTLIDDCVKMIAAQTGVVLDPALMPLDDARPHEPHRRAYQRPVPVRVGRQARHPEALQADRLDT